MTAEDIVESLRSRRTAGQSLLAVSAGTGGVAQAAEAAGADFLVLYNSGLYRTHGFSSLAGMMPYGDANAIVVEMGSRILPAVGGIPVLAGVCATDPFRSMNNFLRQLRDMGFAGVQNFPTVGLIDGTFRDDLEATGISIDQEIEMIAQAHELGLFTCAFVCDSETAIKMARAGADVIAPHLGVSREGGDLASAAAQVQEMADAARAVSPTVLILFHGGPAVTPADVSDLLSRTQGVDGYFAASSVERHPIQAAVSAAVGELKAVELDAEPAGGYRPTIQLDELTLPDYLESRGLVADRSTLRIDALGGGISNLLVRFQSSDALGVLKQSLPQLQVEQVWMCDVRRIIVERNAIEVFTPLLPDGAVPKVTYFDDENYLFVMESAPEGATLWKTDLLAGTILQPLFTQAGSYLAAMHAGTHDDEALRRGFGVGMMFDLRVEPYFLSAAARHPEFASAFDAAIRAMLTDRQCLVHGDFVPKNMLVVDQEDLVLLDYEIVHYGNPAYDLATFMNHILLKSFALVDHVDALCDDVGAFLRSYRDHGGLDVPDRDVLLLLGCLMLARVDSKSPVEYLVDEDTKESVRGLARRILSGEFSSLNDVIDARRRRAVG
ncbi:MAG: phosphoenolpyruvate hydrolase family protein [Microcella sp.]|uniref:phosphoenolpyruvate hydrolase family protein n=1 Tax=Microcella sp. TaxID=1913979 RepID=UPI00331631F0